MTKSIYKTQTCNGNPEVIRTENGIAKEIVYGEKTQITKEEAARICKIMNSGLTAEFHGGSNNG